MNKPLRTAFAVCKGLFFWSWEEVGTGNAACRTSVRVSPDRRLPRTQPKQDVALNGHRFSRNTFADQGNGGPSLDIRGLA